MDKTMEIYETRRRVFNRDGWQCQYPGCTEPAQELAHRIANTKANRNYIKHKCLLWLNIDLSERQVDRIIHHPFNLVSVCKSKMGAHNDYFNCGGSPQKTETLLANIIKNTIEFVDGETILKEKD